MELTITRLTKEGSKTYGVLMLGDKEVCRTLEKCDREVLGSSVEVWGIPGDTSIPVGRYKVATALPVAPGRHSLTLIDVPGFPKAGFGLEPYSFEEGMVQLYANKYRRPTNEVLSSFCELILIAQREKEEVWVTFERAYDAIKK